MSQTAEPVAEQIDEYLRGQQRIDLLRFIACGSVDDGKSTLIGRLLYESHMIFEDQLAALRSDSAVMGTQGDELDLALLVDGLAAEREQGITSMSPTGSSPPTGASSSSPTPRDTSSTPGT